MAQHPFLKSIRPVNLLSFGPNTEEIELRPLNILIGPNGSGKSNLIEIIGLLSKLPERNPWTKVSETGGASEWKWKGRNEAGKPSSISVITTAEEVSMFSGRNGEKSLFYSIGLWAGNGSFAVITERFLEIEVGEDGMLTNRDAYIRDESESASHTEAANIYSNSAYLPAPLSRSRSVLSMVRNVPNLTNSQPRIIEFVDNLERFAFYRDWIFGSGFAARQPVSAGQPVEMLLEDASNLAQLLARYQSDFRPTFDRLNELMKQFYDPIKGVEVRIVSTHLQVSILEEGGFSIPAY
ncbi:MAG: AAA family ATPase, partial [Terracidiphilus sp.]